ncbi:MAG: hypothetical protein EBY32_10400 [Proteobacteria bacterium]|nr:hypothetical protein [Pseudomonadota bacterium]
MKKIPLVLFLTLSVLTLANTFAENLLQIADGGFETLPQSDMAIYKSPEAQDALKIRVVNEGAFEDNGCLEIDLPVAAYASVSFPLKRSAKVASLRFAYKGELADGADVKIGIQSYKMENGFKSVDLVHRQTIELTEEATHWQVSIAIKGPAKVWIDGLEVLSE